MIMHKVCTQAAQHVLACCAKTQKQIYLSTVGIGLKESSLGISHKERHRAEKRLKHLQGTRYLTKIMKECKLARERERVGGLGLKWPRELQDTSQPKHMKPSWSGMPSFKIPKADNESFKIPKVRDPNKDRRKIE